MSTSIINEPLGFKITVGSFSAWLISILNNLDFAQVVGFIGLVVGLAIQVASYYRNRKADKIQIEASQRSIEADERNKKEHELQMALLQKQLAQMDKKEE